MPTKLLLPLLLSMSTALACFGQATPAAPSGSAPLKRVEEASFGRMADGAEVKVFTLTNAKGMQARVLTLGGIIAGVKAADKAGNFTNVCASQESLQGRFGLQAQTIGRVANRIGVAKFTLDGKEYTFQANNGSPVLHSGTANFGTRLWEGAALPPKEHEGAAQLTFVSPDGDGGFPGKLTLKVTYALNDDNEFSLTYEATTDKTTIVNFTNHAYWNLGGAAGWGNGAASPIADHELWIDADKMLPVDAALIPTGEITPVAGTAFDFTKPTVIGSRAAQLPRRSYDTPYVLNSAGKLATVARLRDPKSGREMEVRTDQPGLQLYTGQATGVALETQHHPDSIHHENFPTTVLKAGETLKTTTIYAFSAK